MVRLGGICPQIIITAPFNFISFMHRATDMEQLPFEKNDRQAIIFIGIQASGKTTFYHRMLSDGTYTHISLDILHTRKREKRLLMQCLSVGRPFVIDNTNPAIADRSEYIRQAKAHGYQVIGIFFQSIVRDSITRNAKRTHKVPAQAIADTSNRLQLPSTLEGFDQLYFVRIEDDRFVISFWNE